ncbi:MotA/TolQ/ExbB proton channel family protein [Zavarzinia compransoris]|uniref:Biopolymer transporter ExbD n=1 Tax=Zavarzinia compransoris TaxID=1264899 RepID=A0A317DU74_9PROT|nr:MotA/TolQ/ExbB proton channel family protein [Zavarzinia compransoris]PWR18237.1 biopolymer transporter ExbD [Zavarzinia compransoris]TDP40869.1 outer membrane transport energization protein ExbB [Zavarzinia compransoris]
MPSFEQLLGEVAGLFLLPVLALIVLSLVYAFFALGAFLVEGGQRRRGRHRSRLAALRTLASDDLELRIMRRLEVLRIVARSTPMLGLVATMIPMGPALLALGRNDAAKMGEQMAVAFSAVILALVAASIAFAVLTVRRRWLLEDLRAIERERTA